MGYLDPEAPLADAYRTTARQVAAETARDAFITRVYDETLRALAENKPTTAYWDVRPVTSICADMVAWVLETDDDPTATLGRALASPTIFAKALRERYALARAEHEADRRCWTAESEEAREWERGGRP